MLESIARAGQADAGAARRRSTRPTPSSGSRICTCRTSRSGAPRRRSRARPASSRWPTRCSPTRRSIPAPRREPRRFVDGGATGRPRRQGRARRRAPDPDRAVRRGRRAARPRCASVCGSTACWSRRVAEGKERRRRQVPRLLRRYAEPLADGALAPRAGAVPRPQRGGAALALRLPEDDRRRRRRTSSRRTPASARSPRAVGIADQGRPADAWLARDRARWTWRVKLALAARDRAVRAACASAPRPRRSACSRATCTTCCWRRRPARASTIGLDPGLRTGVKVAVVDAHRQGARRPRRSIRTCRATTGTARSRTLGAAGAAARRRADQHRQRHRLARDRPARGRADQAPPRAAADQGRGVARPARRCTRPRSSRLAGVPDLDVTPARRGLDRAPAAGSAGRTGQDRPEVDRRRPVPARRRTRCSWRKQLDAVVEDCVNAVGVDVNTASAPLLARVSGLSTGAGREHRAHRDEHGAVPQSREQLHDVPRLGAEDLRAGGRLPAHPDGDNPLDASARAPGGLPGGRAHPRATCSGRAPR